LRMLTQLQDACHLYTVLPWLVSVLNAKGRLQAAPRAGAGNIGVPHAPCTIPCGWAAGCGRGEQLMTDTGMPTGKIKTRHYGKHP